MHILGIQFSNHDASAALVSDGEVVSAVSEERVSRRKKDRRFPYGAIADVLAIANLEAKDIDYVAIAGTGIIHRPDFASLFAKGEPVSGKGSHMANLYEFLIGRWYRRFENTKKLYRELEALGCTAPVSFYDHHLSHAASAYFTAGETDPLVITLDGEGDNLCSNVALIKDGTLTVIQKTPWYASPGLIYTFVTEHLGMKRVQHEGKVTGLAAHGDPSVYTPLMREFMGYDKRIQNFYWPFLIGARIDTFFLRTRLRWWPSVIRRHSRLPQATPKTDFETSANIAAATQFVLEENVTAFIEAMIVKTGKKRLALAGGVFANVKLNQRIAELPNVEELFIHPAMGDDGIALGAAFLRAQESGEAKVAPFKTAYLGPSYSDSEITEAMKHYKVAYTKPVDLEEEVASLLAEGKVVALFQGRMEYGPRALGNRSVICSPADKTVNDWLNKKFNRTEFMPFAPVTLEEKIDECYTGLIKGMRAAHFMTICTPCTDEMIRTQPAVVHVDGTARPQLITKEENPRYYGILKAFSEKTGLPSLINTSFNMHEEPIVRSPDDALRAFLSSGLPYLVMEKYLITPRS